MLFAFLFFGLLTLLSVYALYAVIRVAVRHGIRDAQRDRVAQSRVTQDD